MFTKYFTNDELQARATVAEEAIQELLLELLTHPDIRLPVILDDLQLNELTPEFAEWIVTNVSFIDRELYKLTGKIVIELIDFKNAIEELRLRDEAERDAEYYSNALAAEARWLDG